MIELNSELEILAVTFKCDVGSERQRKATQRQLLLAMSSETTSQTKVIEGLASVTDMWTKVGLFGGDVDIEAALEAMRKAIQHYSEAGELSDKPSLKNYMKNLGHAHHLGFITSMSHLERWDMSDVGGSEAGILEGIDCYNFHVCGQVLKAEWLKADMFRGTAFTSPLALLCKFSRIV